LYYVKEEGTTMEKSDAYKVRVERLIAKLAKARVLPSFPVEKYIREVVEHAEVQLTDKSIMALISIQLEIAVDEAMRRLLLEGKIEARHFSSRWPAPVRTIVFEFLGDDDDGAFLRRAGINLEDR
jgi:hypothetical protein